MARLGLAIDIGTTNIVGFAIDFDKPKDFCYQPIKNSQTKHGADLITRLTFCKDKKNFKLLNSLLINDINNLIHAICKKIKINRKRIEKIVVAANTIMLHFLLNLDVDGFKSYPYKSLINGVVVEQAKNFGIVAGKNTQLITLPPISPYLGADVTAGILYTKMHKISRIKFFLDLGTNAEMVLGNKNELWATSAAAGSAFKGKNLLLGSEFISLVAKLLQEKTLLSDGNLIDETTVSQKDIRNFQLAKSAIRAAFDILKERAKIKDKDISKILIAGLFGEKISIDDAIVTGIIPFLGKNRVRAIGNSSLEGAKLVLKDEKKIAEAEFISKFVKTIELNLESSYQEKFISYLNF